MWQWKQTITISQSIICELIDWWRDEIYWYIRPQSEFTGWMGKMCSMQWVQFAWLNSDCIIKYSANESKNTKYIYFLVFIWDIEERCHHTLNETTIYIYIFYLPSSHFSSFHPPTSLNLSLFPFLLHRFPSHPLLTLSTINFTITFYHTSTLPILFSVLLLAIDVKATTNWM